MSEEISVTHDLGPHVRIKLVRDEHAENPEGMTDIPIYLVHFHPSFEHCGEEAPVSSIEELAQVLGSRPLFPPERMVELISEMEDTDLEHEHWHEDDLEKHLRDNDCQDDEWLEYVEEKDEWADALDRSEWVFFPVASYIHSGVSLSVLDTVMDYRRGWDKSLCGAVFIRKEGWGEAHDNEGYAYKNGEEVVTVTWKEIAESHIEEWNKYLVGDCWGYVIEVAQAVDGEDTAWEEVDSCWGYLGEDVAKDAALDQARAYRDDIVCVHEPDWVSMKPSPDSEAVVDVWCRKCGQSGSTRVTVKEVQW